MTWIALNWGSLRDDDITDWRTIECINEGYLLDTYLLNQVYPSLSSF